MSKDKQINMITVLRLRHSGTVAQTDLDALAAQDPALHDQLTDWNLQDAALRTLYNPVAEETVPERHRNLLSAAERRWQLSPAVLARIAAVLLAVSLASATGWGLAQLTPSAPVKVALATEALRAHAAYATEVRHAVEVPASDKAHLSAWLSKRLGRQITPPEFTAYGFRLMGGRILPSSYGIAAMMIYENDQGQRVSLYVVRKSTEAETAFRFAKTAATAEFWWIDEDIACAVVADLPRGTLRNIADTAYNQLVTAS
ncbi:MAG: anti-sigma factor [Rhodobacterales bacterium]